MKAVNRLRKLATDRVFSRDSREDKIAPLSQGLEFAKHIPGSRLIIYDETGHVPMEETPLRTATDVSAFLSSL